MFFTLIHNSIPSICLLCVILPVSALTVWPAGCQSDDRHLSPYFILPQEFSLPYFDKQLAIRLLELTLFPSWIIAGVFISPSIALQFWCLFSICQCHMWEREVLAFPSSLCVTWEATGDVLHTCEKYCLQSMCDPSRLKFCAAISQPYRWLLNSPSLLFSSLPKDVF